MRAKYEEVGASNDVPAHYPRPLQVDLSALDFSCNKLAGQLLL